MSDVDSRLARIEEQTKYTKETIEEVVRLQRQQTEFIHLNDLKFVRFEGKFAILEDNIAKIEDKLDSLEPPAPVSKISMASWTTGIASVVSAIIIGILEYLKQ